MNLFDVVLLVALFAAGTFFWRIRSISEYASQYLKHYCEQQNLQLISVARKTTKPMVYRGKLDWRSDFIFEFSATGDDCYQGFITMNGRTVVKTELPPHRMNSFH
ncbi:DUF3301 domain-containing protein [Alteromonas gilva]|uniref:DUF3301 domain-containing protein n=1 Tax=Alteromonas gilva TaxID=2987522 RepID=A0ABT5L3P2_9ALTE|nr:DUF3301 domain-containing protein [Alteromonas gilva]MDC8830393.1 DUF3301 domain-containing protein [Alteromonas gilva]